MASTISAGTTSGTAIVVSGDTSGVLQLASNGSTTAVTIDTSQRVGVGTASPAVLVHVQSTTSTTDAVTQVLRLDSQSSGTPANGIGVGIQFSTETAAGNTEIGATIEAITTDVTATSEDFDISFKTMAAGAAAAERMRVKSTGDFQFNSGYGSVATAYGCRAWVNFNGTGTVAIRASGNVTSITDNGVGNYTMNFTTAMPDTNYCCTMNGRTGGGVQSIITVNRDSSPTTTTNPIYVVNPSTPGILQDEAFCMIAVFR
jgi:hypothetical protein